MISLVLLLADMLGLANDFNIVLEVGTGWIPVRSLLLPPGRVARGPHVVVGAHGVHGANVGHGVDVVVLPVVVAGVGVGAVVDDGGRRGGPLGLDLLLDGLHDRDAGNVLRAVPGVGSSGSGLKKSIS